MVTKDGAKMSKSKGNVVSPASIVERVGADTARCYILFVGPPDQDADWSDDGRRGRAPLPRRGCGAWPRRRPSARAARRRAGRPAGAPQGDDLALAAQGALGDRQGQRRPAPLRLQHGDRGGDGAAQRLLAPARVRPTSQTLRFALATAASLLFPFAPHVCADIYDLLTGERVWEQPWPQADEALLEREVYELVCQVNGKLRDRVQASADASPEELKELCRAAPNVQRARRRQARSSRRSSCPGKLVNLVVR